MKKKQMRGRPWSRHTPAARIYSTPSSSYSAGNPVRIQNNMNLKRILCTEDDPDIQAVARLSLEMVGGFEVSTGAAGH
jgi:hypothetical protein